MANAEAHHEQSIDQGSNVQDDTFQCIAKMGSALHCCKDKMRLCFQMEDVIF